MGGFEVDYGVRVGAGGWLGKWWRVDGRDGGVGCGLEVGGEVVY